MSTLTPEDRARLRDLAAKATPGPWEAEHGSDWDSDEGQVAQSSVRRADRVAITWDDHGGEVFMPADAEFIAAADPATVTALLDDLDAAEAELVTEHQAACAAREVMARHHCDEQAERAYRRAERAEAAVQRVREMHEPVPVSECTTACSCSWWSHADCPTVIALDGDA